MENKKRNRREEYTLKTIREVFLEMLRKKPIEKISVGELCQKADINRSTFYRHYADVYALLDAITDECYEELFKQLAATLNISDNFQISGYDVILRACEITEQNMELYQLLLFGKTGTKLLRQIMESSFNLYFEAHLPSSYLPAPEVHLHYQYLVHGITGVWATWIQEGCILPKESVATIITKQMTAFFNVMNNLYWPPKN